MREAQHTGLDAVPSDDPIVQIVIELDSGDDVGANVLLDLPAAALAEEMGVDLIASELCEGAESAVVPYEENRWSLRWVVTPLPRSNQAAKLRVEVYGWRRGRNVLLLVHGFSSL
jgi:hypothetical protein